MRWMCVLCVAHYCVNVAQREAEFLEPRYCVRRLAGHLRTQGEWITVQKVIDHSRIPIIKALAVHGDCSVQVCVCVCVCVCF